jgi:sorbitol-specific phosphotransferase system component IIBC
MTLMDPRKMPEATADSVRVTVSLSPFARDTVIVNVSAVVPSRFLFSSEMVK